MTYRSRKKHMCVHTIMNVSSSIRVVQEERNFGHLKQREIHKNVTIDPLPYIK